MIAWYSVSNCFCAARPAASADAKPNGTIRFTAAAPAENWDKLSKQVKGDTWIRVEQTFSIKELNNLVVEGRFTARLAMSINGRETYSIRDDGDTAGTWALTKAGIRYSATVYKTAVFGIHYQPERNRPALCAMCLKSLPLDYLEENTPTKKWVVMDGTNYLRDTEVTVGRDGKYYMTGTAGTYEFMFKKERGSDGKLHHWLFNQSIPLWVSDDLKNWKSLGYVWQFDRDGTWAKEIGKRQGANARAVYAPDIHYFPKHDRYYIVYGPNTTRHDGQSYGVGILESREPQGPYQEVTGTKPICGGYDGNLFEDDDGSAYLTYSTGNIAKMKPTMDGFADTPRHIYPHNSQSVAKEGTTLFKYNGNYYFSGALRIRSKYPDGTLDNTYDNVMCVSTNGIYGPYGDRFVAIKNGGNNSFFQDSDGKWYRTVWQPNQKPTIIAVELAPDGTWRPAENYDVLPNGIVY